MVHLQEYTFRATSLAMHLQEYALRGSPLAMHLQEYAFRGTPLAIHLKEYTFRRTPITHRIKHHRVITPTRVSTFPSPSHFLIHGNTHQEEGREGGIVYLRGSCVAIVTSASTYTYADDGSDDGSGDQTESQDCQQVNDIATDGDGGVSIVASAGKEESAVFSLLFLLLCSQRGSDEGEEDSVEYSCKEKSREGEKIIV